MFDCAIIFSLCHPAAIWVGNGPSLARAFDVRRSALRAAQMVSGETKQTEAALTSAYWLIGRGEAWAGVGQLLAADTS